MRLLMLVTTVTVVTMVSMVTGDRRRWEEHNLGLTPDEVRRYGKFLSFAFDVHRTPMGRYLQGATVPDFRRIQSSLSLTGITEMLKSDPEKRKRVAELFMSHQQQLIAVKNTAGRVPRMTIEQTEGWEGCKLDYGAFVEPITSALFNLLLPIICEELELPPFLCPDPIPEPEMPDWGLAMIDAMGKIPAGLGDGNLHWSGAYEMCQNDFQNVVYNNTLTPGVTEERSFNGKYCRLSMSTVESEPGLGNLSLPLFLGACVPDTCSMENITRYIQGDLQDGNFVLGVVLDLLGLQIDDIFCGQNPDASTDRGFQATLGILIGLAVLVLLSTIYDGFIRKHYVIKYLKTLPRLPRTPPLTPQSPSAPSPASSERGYDNVGYVPYIPSGEEGKNSNNNAKPGSLEFHSQFSSASSSPLLAEDIKKENRIGCADRFELAFVGFSGYSNFKRIWKLTQKDDHIPVLNGIRVLSLGWAILGYTWLLGPIYAESFVTANLRRIVTQFPSDWDKQFIVNFHFSAEAYFVISGLLTSYWWLKWFEKRERITCGMAAYYFLHKYWKMMPPLMLSVAVYSTFYRFLGSGPLYPTEISDAETCRAGYWWKNLVMLHNIVDNDKMCLAWMWYVPMIFQLHLVAIIILVPLVLKEWVGYIMMTAMFLAHLGATVGESHKIHDTDEIAFLDWFRKYYLAPWCRAGPYVIGLALGKIIYEFKKGKKKIYMHPAVAVVGWLLALALITTPVYVTYDFLKEGGEPWGTSQFVAWDTLSRTSLGLGVAWIIYACTVGYGGIITKFLSYPLWLPFSRLSYQTLMTGAMLMFVRVYTNREPLLVNESTQMQAFHRNVLVCFFYGLVLSLLWVYPLCVGLEKAVLCKRRLDWIRAGRHPIEETNQIEKEYNHVLNGKHEPTHAQYRSFIYEVPRYDNVTTGTGNGLHKRLNPDVEKQEVTATPVSTAM